MEELKVGDFVTSKLTGEKGQIISNLGDIGYLIRFGNYSEIALRSFEIEVFKGE